MSKKESKLKLNIENIKKSRWVYILISAIFVLLGLMLIFDPNGTSSKLAFLFGGALIAYGAFKLISYFTKNKGEKNVSADVIIGVVLAIGGLAIIVLHDEIATILSYIFGAFLIVDGMLKIQTAINAKRAKIDSWWIVLLGSILCIAFGCVLIFAKFADNALWIALGVALLFDGAQNLISALFSHLIVKKAPKDSINLNDHAPTEPQKELKA